ncbi:hypothetical protein [Nocardia sp. CY41]|nr:hypothetical protein [Nocardia sp. CY41]
MNINYFNGLDLVVVFDVRNVEAHLTGAIEDCVARVPRYLDRH